MNQKLDLNAQNMVTVMLVQALWGAISPNFRLVALEVAEPIWQLLFVLEKEDAKDREEIEDIAGEFDALLLGLTTGCANYEIKVVISDEPLPILDHSQWRLVFHRRET